MVVRIATPPVIELKRSRDNKWYFHVRNRNGEITSASQRYASRQGARRRARQEFPTLQIVVSN